jgi:hypothetical protein
MGFVEKKAYECNHDNSSWTKQKDLGDPLCCMNISNKNYLVSNKNYLVIDHGISYQKLIT